MNYLSAGGTGMSRAARTRAAGSRTKAARTTPTATHVRRALRAVLDREPFGAGEMLSVARIAEAGRSLEAATRGGNVGKTLSTEEYLTEAPSVGVSAGYGAFPTSVSFDNNETFGATAIREIVGAVSRLATAQLSPKSSGGAEVLELTQALVAAKSGGIPAGVAAKIEARLRNAVESESSRGAESLRGTESLREKKAANAGKRGNVFSTNEDLRASREGHTAARAEKPARAARRRRAAAQARQAVPAREEAQAAPSSKQVRPRGENLEELRAELADRARAIETQNTFPLR